MKSIFKKIAIVSISILICFIINYYIEMMFIPDECYYHVHDGGIIFNLFYDLPSWNGGYPWPSNLNFIFTFIIGTTLGFVIQKKI